MIEGNKPDVDTRKAVILHYTPEMSIRSEFGRYEIEEDNILAFFKDRTWQIFKRRTDLEEADADVSSVAEKLSVAFFFHQGLHVQSLNAIPIPVKEYRRQHNKAYLGLEIGRDRYQVFSGYEFDDIYEAIQKDQDEELEYFGLN